MAKLILEWDIPGYTKEELQTLVAAVDERDSYPEPGIEAAYVKASHIVELTYTGNLAFIEGEISEAIMESDIEVPVPPIPQLQYFYVKRDEIVDET